MSSVRLAATVTHDRTTLPDIVPCALVLRLRLLPALSRVLHAAGNGKGSLHAGQAHYLDTANDSDLDTFGLQPSRQYRILPASTQPREAALSTRTTSSRLARPLVHRAMTTSPSPRGCLV